MAAVAAIDRYVDKERDAMKLRGVPTTKPGALLRASVLIRQAGDEYGRERGYFEIGAVAACAPALRGEFASRPYWRTGWAQLEAMCNSARPHMFAA